MKHEKIYAFQKLDQKEEVRRRWGVQEALIEKKENYI